MYIVLSLCYFATAIRKNKLVHLLKVISNKKKKKEKIPRMLNNGMIMSYPMISKMTTRDELPQLPYS